MKKQYILLLLALSTALSFTACGNTSQDASAGTVSTEMIVNTELNSDTESTVTEQSSEITEVEETEVTEIETEVAYDDEPVYEIVNGCYKGVPLQGETMRDSWTKQVTWRGSNGTYIKINDEWADYVERTGDGSIYAIWEKDPDKDLRPDADYMRAVDEFIYSDEAYHNGMDRYDPEVVNVDNLPKVSTVSEKKDSFVATNEFQAYIEEWNLYHSFQATGFWETSILHSVHYKDDFVGCIREGEGYLWKIERESDYWKLTINTNPSELNWHGILTCMKMVSPDAESVYDYLYNVFYSSNYSLVDDVWYDVPNSNSKILAPSGYSEAVVYFK